MKKDKFIPELDRKKLIKNFMRVYNPKRKKCPRCGSKNMFYDSDAGPIVGGLIVMIADKKTGRVHPSQGAHHTGAWICLDCIEREKQSLPSRLERFKKFEETLERVKQIRIDTLLKCPRCGKKFVKIDEHNYRYDCGCIGNKEIRISVG